MTTKNEHLDPPPDFGDAMLSPANPAAERGRVDLERRVERLTREIDRLARFYSTLSHVNQCIVRVHSQDELFKEVCRIAVESGGFKMAWIGWRDRETQEVKVMARAGSEDGYLDMIKVFADDRAEGRGPTGTCIREARASVFNDFLNDPNAAPWREAASARGLRSVAALPIRYGGDIGGSFTVYAHEPDVFQDREIALLEEMTSDISFALKRFRDEGRRLELQNQLAQTAATLPGMIYSFQLFPDGSSRMPYTSAAIADIFGLQPGDARQDAGPAFAAIVPGDIAHVRETIAASARDMAPWWAEFRVRHPVKGEVWVEGHSMPQRESDGSTLWHGFIQDITERKQVEAHLRQSQKIEAIGQLAGGVAHDFNNVLSATMMNLEMLKAHPALAGELVEPVDELISHAQRAAALTRQLLLFSRRSELRAEKLDLNHAVENLLKMLRRLIGERIKLVWRKNPGLPPVFADASMMEQVILNLVVNARDAMPDGGLITIAADALEITVAEAKKHPESRPGRFVCLSAQDNGCGMSESVLGRIFEPFFTTKEAGKGTGLGLATVDGIVRQHKGWITVESEVGQGSVFRVFLPALEEVSASLAQNSNGEPARGGDETILLVEDDIVTRKSIAARLRQLGYNVLEASSGPEALVLWRANREKVAALFTDMVLPEGQSGLELAEQIQAGRPGLPVIVCTGYSPDMFPGDPPAERSIYYLQKPGRPAEIARLLRRCLDKPGG
jgi:PAS domain S-box-containing protein